jgi:transposase
MAQSNNQIAKINCSPDWRREQDKVALAPDVHAARIWDGAGFHRARDLVVPSNITLMPLPPYSPELNGIENLWHDLRSHG